MQKNMKLAELVEQAGVLKTVESFSFPELPLELSCLNLQFDKRNCFISVNIDTDEIILIDFFQTKQFTKIQNHSLWEKFIGKDLVWAWALVNNQGYNDGIRFEFKEIETSVEFIVIASSLKTYLSENA